MGLSSIVCNALLLVGYIVFVLKKIECSCSLCSAKKNELSVFVSCFGAIAEGISADLRAKEGKN